MLKTGKWLQRDNCTSQSIYLSFIAISTSESILQPPICNQAFIKPSIRGPAFPPSPTPPREFSLRAMPTGLYVTTSVLSTASAIDSTTRPYRGTTFGLVFPYRSVGRNHRSVEFLNEGNVQGTMDLTTDDIFIFNLDDKLPAERKNMIQIQNMIYLQENERRFLSFSYIYQERKQTQWMVGRCRKDHRTNLHVVVRFDTDYLCGHLIILHIISSRGLLPKTILHSNNTSKSTKHFYSEHFQITVSISSLFS